MGSLLEDKNTDIRETLTGVGGMPDDVIDVADVALLLGALDRPGVGLDRYRHNLAKLVAGFRPGQATSTLARAEALAAYLFGVEGFTGDNETYDNLENASLLSVIDRRRGLPVAITILYLHLARAQDWRAAAINFPGHVLFRLEGEKDRIMLDPFRGGRVLNTRDLRALLKASVGTEAELRPELYAPLSNRALLVRLQNNIKVRALTLGDMTRAVDVLRRITAFAPMEVEALYELGVLLIHQEKFREGRDALETCLGRLDYMTGNGAGKQAELRPQVLRTLSELSASLDG